MNFKPTSLALRRASNFLILLEYLKMFTDYSEFPECTEENLFDENQMLMDLAYPFCDSKNEFFDSEKPLRMKKFLKRNRTPKTKRSKWNHITKYPRQKAKKGEKLSMSSRPRIKTFFEEDEFLLSEILEFLPEISKSEILTNDFFNPQLRLVVDGNHIAAASFNVRKTKFVVEFNN